MGPNSSHLALRPTPVNGIGINWFAAPAKGVFQFEQSSNVVVCFDQQRFDDHTGIESGVLELVGVGSSWFELAGVGWCWLELAGVGWELTGVVPKDEQIASSPCREYTF